MSLSSKKYIEISTVDEKQSTYFIPVIVASLLLSLIVLHLKKAINVRPTVWVMCPCPRKPLRSKFVLICYREEQES